MTNELNHMISELILSVMFTAMHNWIVRGFD